VVLSTLAESITSVSSVTIFEKVKGALHVGYELRISLSYFLTNQLKNTKHKHLVDLHEFTSSLGEFKAL
jgi:hypothetical protein